MIKIKAYTNDEVIHHYVYLDSFKSKEFVDFVVENIGTYKLLQLFEQHYKLGDYPEYDVEVMSFINQYIENDFSRGEFIRDLLDYYEINATVIRHAFEHSMTYWDSDVLASYAMSLLEKFFSILESDGRDFWNSKDGC